MYFREKKHNDSAKDSREKSVMNEKNVNDLFPLNDNDALQAMEENLKNLAFKKDVVLLRLYTILIILRFLLSLLSLLSLKHITVFFLKQSKNYKSDQNLIFKDRLIFVHLQACSEKRQSSVTYIITMHTVRGQSIVKPNIIAACI